MTLSREQEEMEQFIEDYTNQIRWMSSMDDVQIKVLIRQLIIDDPEWYEVIRERFRKKQLIKAKALMKGVMSDVHGSIKDLARRVA